jgi:hypothetical protein
VALPDVGDKRVQRIFIVVDLPAPFGPRNPKIVPSSTSMDTLLMALTAPNCFERFSTLIIDIREV